MTYQSEYNQAIGCGGNIARRTLKGDLFDDISIKIPYLE